MAGTLEEFDQPSSLPVRFCQQISPEEYDRQAAETTQAALEGLMKHLNSNPNEYFKIVRQRKEENLNFLQAMKFKLMKRLQDGYVEKYFPEEECQKDLDKLKREMRSVYKYNYSQEKRKLQDPGLAYSAPSNKSALPPPPPPPPPSPVNKMSDATSTKFIFPPTLNSNNTNKQHRRKTSVIVKKDIVDAKNKLKSTRLSSAPYTSPYQLSRARRKESENEEEGNNVFFNMELLKKFQSSNPSSDP